MQRKSGGKIIYTQKWVLKTPLICPFMFNSLQYFGLESLKGTLNHTSQPANRVLIKTVLTLMDWTEEI